LRQVRRQAGRFALLQQLMENAGLAAAQHIEHGGAGVARVAPERGIGIGERRLDLAQQAALGRMRRLIAHRRLVLQRLQRPHQMEGLRLRRFRGLAWLCPRRSGEQAEQRQG
jgi:hypothetical protein